jgi:glycosyltransferase involved in cell wall biosynthesis
MKIAVITPGILPVPAVRGGAVETLTEYLLEYNEKSAEHDIVLFGAYDKELDNFDFSVYKRTRFDLMRQTSLIMRAKRKIFNILKRDFIYDYYSDFYIREVSRKISRIKFDIVIVENRPGFLIPLAHVSSAKRVLHLHNDTLNPGTKNAGKIIDACDSIITVSGFLKEKILSVSPEARVNVVYNGIDLYRFTKPVTFKENRSVFGLDQNDFVVVYTGRIEPIKGIKELMEAFVILSANKDIKLLLVGGDIYADGNESGFIQELRDLHSKTKNQVFFAGYQPYDKIPEILHFCDIAVIPSTCEDGLTMASLEDMAVGLPLIVTRSGGIPEAVDENCAIIIDKEEKLSLNLAEAIMALYSNREKREEMSFHARERSSGFSKEKYTERFFSVLSH